MTTAGYVNAGRADHPSLIAIAAAAPPPRNAYVYTKYCTYPGAYPITYVALRVGISANALTWLDFVVTLIGIALLACSGPRTSPMLAMIAWGLLTLGYILDSADGQVARTSGTVSPLGEWLDHVLDVAKHVTVNLTYAWLLLGSGTSVPSGVDFLLVSLSLLSMEVAFFSSMLRHKLERAARGPSGKVISRLGALLRAPAHLCDYGIFVCFALLLPWLDWFRITFTVYVAICCLARLGGAVRAAGALRRIVAQTS